MLQAQYHYYFGNLHAHTAYSDGNRDSMVSGITTPGQAFDYVKQSYHMDFLGISEHNHYNASNNPGMRLADYHRGLFQADTANRDGEFLCFYGMEWGVISNGGHLITYGVPQLVGWESGNGLWGTGNNYDIYCWKYDYTRFWQIVNSFPQGFCTMAHPQTGDYNDLFGNAAYSASADSALVGLAIRSGQAFNDNDDYSSPAPTNYQSVYLKTLAKGYRVGPVCDQDNHNSNYGRTNRIRTVMLADTLTRDSLVAAYKAMRFYASDDWDTEVDFRINGNPMGTEFTANQPAQITVTVNDPGNLAGGTDSVQKIEIFYGIPGSGQNATLLTSVNNQAQLNYTHTAVFGTRYYYFAKITQADGDIAWTSPIWVLHESVTLPVYVKEWKGRSDNSTIFLNWELENWQEIGHAVVEYSTDGIHFTPLVTISNEYSQQYLHESPRDGVNYYRLAVSDRNGGITYSHTLAFTIQTPVFSHILLSPNPAQDKIALTVDSRENKNLQIRIYDNDGRLLRLTQMALQTGRNRSEWDISNLPAGLYYMEIRQAGIRVSNLSFIKL